MDQAVKVNFGCGVNVLPGWRNHDQEVDIREPLPYGDASVQYVLAEHVVEHVTHQEAWGFFEELYRILAPDGVARICVPCVERIFRADATYLDFIARRGWGDGSVKSAVRAAVFLHGHKSAWTKELLVVFLKAVGFRVKVVKPHESAHQALQDCEGHWKSVGGGINLDETGVVEATRPKGG